jgi:hypothetical protein
MAMATTPSLNATNRRNPAYSSVELVALMAVSFAVAVGFPSMSGHRRISPNSFLRAHEAADRCVGAATHEVSLSVHRGTPPYGTEKSGEMSISVVVSQEVPNRGEDRVKRPVR